MTVELTPKGTYGARMPKIPPPLGWVFWKLFSLGARLRGSRLLDLTTVGARTGRKTHPSVVLVPRRGRPAGSLADRGLLGRLPPASGLVLQSGSQPH